MRHGCVLFVGLFFGGCVLESPTTGLWNRIHPFQGLTGADVIQLDVAVLEAPIADPILNQDLWKLADELELTPETQTLLEKNGLRIGQIGGIAPEELQALLTSERSCVFSRRIQLRSGSSRSLVLGPALDRCCFVLHENAGDRPVNLEKGRYLLSVAPTLPPDAAGGPLGARTQLRFTPEIQLASNDPTATAVLSRIKKDDNGWDSPERQPTECYANLAWDVTLAPNDYVLIGTWYDRPNTLGGQCFTRTEESPPVQRILVLRTTRSIPTVETEIASSPNWRPSTYSQSPSLAAQASGNSLR